MGGAENQMLNFSKCLLFGSIASFLQHNGLISQTTAKKRFLTATGDNIIRFKMFKFNKTPRVIATRTPEQELGFGKTITGSTQRLMNPDGRFNVERQSTGLMDNTYFDLVTMTWTRFVLLALLAFTVMNCLFAFVYICVGVEHLNGITSGSFWQNFGAAYFFSSQTLTTVGYGHISPQGLLANIVASFESFLGLVSFALISGLLYGRFSRQRAKIVFSENMLIAPYRNGNALMFRMGNARRSEIIEVEVQMMLSINQLTPNQTLERKFFALELEIKRVSFFSLSWTIVHPLDERSPINGFSLEDLGAGNAEVLVLVKGMDEANHNNVHARRSYIPEEIVENARFLPVISRNKKGLPHVLNRQIGSYELLAPAVEAVATT